MKSRYLTPVIHVKNQDQVLANVERCQAAGTKGFFLINHGITCNKLAGITAAVRNQFPKAWIGINVLDESPLQAIPKFCQIDGFWTDLNGLVEGNPTQELAQSMRDCLKAHQPQALYFASVAFKYQPQPLDLQGMTRLARGYMDVITTSGEGTGRAADISKIQQMAAAAGDHPLAIASGITLGNITQYLPYITWFLVATGISSDFCNLDISLVKRLQDSLQG